MNHRSASDMSGDELRVLLTTLTPGEMRGMLTYLAGYDPAGFDQAYATVKQASDDGGTP